AVQLGEAGVEVVETELVQHVVTADEQAGGSTAATQVDGGQHVVGQLVADALADVGGALDLLSSDISGGHDDDATVEQLTQLGAVEAQVRATDRSQAVEQMQQLADSGVGRGVQGRHGRGIQLVD